MKQPHPGPALLALSLTLLFCSQATLADKEDSDTGITGTEEADSLTVTEPTTATATTTAVGAEKLTSTATAIDSLGGDDTVTTSVDEISPTVSTAIAGGAFLDLAEVNLDAPQPGSLTEDHSVETVATATGVDSGDGADTVDNGSVLLTTANAVSGANGVEVNAAGSGELTTRTEASAKAAAVGIKAGAGADRVSNILLLSSIADATAEAVSLDIAAADTENPGRNVKSNVEARVTAEATATGIDSEDDATETNSTSTSPLDGGGLRFTSSETTATVSGDDVVTNAGIVSTEALVLAGSGSAAISAQASGTSSSNTDVTATASSNGIATGGGSDRVTNAAALTSHATSTSGAVGLTVSIANTPSGDPANPGPSDDDDVGNSTTNVTATAAATGIDAEGSGHTTTTDRVTEIADGALHISRQQTAASVAGDDTVTNLGIVDVTANATAVTETAAVTVGTGGSAGTEANVTATSNGLGIFTGAGADTVNNAAALTVDAESTARSTRVSVGAGQSTGNPNPDSPLQTHALASSTEGKVASSATASGIDAEGTATYDSRGYELTIGADGLSLSRNWATTAEAGNDTVGNGGLLTVSATATADSDSVGAQFDASGSVNSDTSVDATSVSSGVYTGGGADYVINSGLLNVSATSDADALAATLTVTEAPETDGNPADALPGKSNLSSASGVTSTASAVGIDAEGSQHDDSGRFALDITRNALGVTWQTSERTLAGNDQVVNQGIVNTNATATSGSIAAAVDIEAAGSTDSNAESQARADALGIATGGGADDILNDGALSSIATANAGALSVGVTVSQPQTDTDPSTSLLDKLKDKFASTSNVANATAAASATGIDAEGEDHDVEQTFSTSISGAGLNISYDRTTIADAGDDDVTNTGALVTFSEAGTASGVADVNVDTQSDSSVTAAGTTAAEANASSSASSNGILTGGGDDDVTNSGAVTADAVSVAGTISAAFSQTGPGAPSSSDSKAESSATTTGIATDNGAADETVHRALSISENGVDLVFRRSETAQQGADTVTNDGLLTTTALAASAAVGVSIVIDTDGNPSAPADGASAAKSKADGAASSDVVSTATAVSTGLDTGGGADTIDNGGVINATAGSAALAVGLGFGQNQTPGENPKVKVAASTTAESTATGIAADSGADTTVSTTLAISADGLDANHHREVTAASGDDIVTSTFGITSTALSSTNSDAVSVAIDGTAQADAAATATSTAAGIVAGGGNDTVTNDGGIVVTSVSDADAISVAVGQRKSDASHAGTIVSAETDSTAIALGVGTDGGAGNSLLDVAFNVDAAGIDFSYTDSEAAATGDDTLINTGAIVSNAWADTGILEAPVTIRGSAQSSLTASALAASTGLDTGGGIDFIDNSGLIEAGALATAMTANAAVTTDGTAIANSGLSDSGTFAAADAVGVSSAGFAIDESTTFSTHVDFDDYSVTSSYLHLVDSVSGDGADTVFNTGDIVALSSAATLQGTVAVDAGSKKAGLAVSVGRSQADATASGLDTGNGADYVENDGVIDSTANAEGVMGTVSVTMKGLAAAGNSVADGGTVATSQATGINADSGEVTATFADLMADPGQANATWGTTITAASGNDTIINENDVSAAADTNILEGSVAVTVKGAAATNSATLSQADATAVNAGAGDDTITSSGTIAATADADSLSAKVSVTAQSGIAASMSGATSSDATAVGIDADGTYLNFEDTTELDATVGTGDDGSLFLNNASSLTMTTRTATASGRDVIVNDGLIDAAATARNAEVAVAVVVSQGVAASVTDSTADADSIGIRGGGGDDDITNRNTITSDADAEAYAVAASVTAVGVGAAANRLMDGGTSATANAAGIDADGGSIDEHIVTIASSLDDTLDSFSTSVSNTTTNGATSGTDIVRNEGDITSRATAISPEVSFAVVTQGVAGAVSTSTADAESSGIRLGGGSDDVISSGNVTAESTATAVAVNVTVDSGGLGLSANAALDGGVNAEARSVGIDTDSGRGEYSSSHEMLISLDENSIVDEESYTRDSGDDFVDNSGDVTADAVAVAVAVTGSYSGAGLAAGVGTSAAQAAATSIDTGGGSDEIINSGTLTADADANADTVTGTYSNAGVALSSDALWSGGTTTTATATGIDADGGFESYTERHEYRVDGVVPTIVDETLETFASGDDIVTNSGDINATATAVSPSIGVAVTPGGLAAAITTATSNADATAIDSGAGTDTITNSGALTASAVSNADAVSVSFTEAGVAIAGDAAWDGGVTANATATGIDATGPVSRTHRVEITVPEIDSLGDILPDSFIDITDETIDGTGDNTITNTNDITVDAVSEATAASIGVALAGVGVAISSASADAVALGIVTGIGNDFIDNTHAITADADAVAVAVNGSGTGAGVALSGEAAWDAGTLANAGSVAIASHGGDDHIINGGALTATSTSTTVATEVSIVVYGVGGAVGTSTVISDSTGIAAGDGVDTIENNGSMVTDATSTAVTVAVGGTFGGVTVTADKTWDGGTSSEAYANSIVAGGDDDTVINTNDVTTTALSRANSISVPITVFGVAAANSTSTSSAAATSIDGGTGNDAITNTGSVLSDAKAHATTVGVGITGIGATGTLDAEWDGGTGSDAQAVGIAGRDGNDSIDNQARVEALAESDADSVQVALSGIIGAVATASSTADAGATALAGGTGDDTITNSSDLIATADADATGTAVSFTAAGVAGSDPFLDNVTTADAAAAGIAGGDGSDTITTLDTSTVDVDAIARTRDDSVSVTFFGLSAGNANSDSTANAVGVDGGDGDDFLYLDGSMTTHASSRAIARSIAVNGIGASLPSARSTTDVTSVGVAAGDGDDTLENNASITVGSTATNVGRAVGVLGIGATATDLGGIDAASATATAAGIDLGNGVDSLLNTGDVDVTATADTDVASVGIAGTGFSSSRASTTAAATSDGILGGDEADTITNGALMAAHSSASAHTTSVSLNFIGAASGHSVITTTSEATGVASGLGDDVVTNLVDGTIAANAGASGETGGQFSLSVAGAAHHDVTIDPTSTATGVDTDGGADTVTNAGRIDVQAVSTSTSDATNVGIAGAGSATVGTEARATATGIDTGDDDDTIINEGTVEVGITDDETEAGDWMAYLDIGASSFELAGATGSSADASATATSTGFGAGSGDDVIVNAGVLDVYGNACSDVSSSAITIFGAAGTGEDAGTTVTVTGIAGGDGADAAGNLGAILVSGHSNLVLDSASYRFGGAGTTGSSLTATTSVTGLAGDAGDDALLNAGGLVVLGRSNLTATGDSNSTFGSADSTGEFGATSTATGMSGGADHDTLLNDDTGSVAVTAATRIDTTSMSNVFAGGSGSDGTVTGRATAAGAAGGDGNDVLANDGVMTVDATALLVANGATSSAIQVGGARSTGEVTTSTSAVGMSGGDGNDDLSTGETALLTVDADAAAESRNTAGSTASLTSTTEAGSSARTNASASGLSGNLGTDSVTSDGTVDVRSNSTAYAYGRANGATISLGGHATSSATARASAGAVGIDGGTGGSVVNNGILTVEARASTTRDLVLTFPILSFTNGGSDPVVSEATISDPDLPPTDSTDFAVGDVIFWTESPTDDPNVAEPGGYYQLAEVEVQVPDGNGGTTTEIQREWQLRETFESEREEIVNALPTVATANGHGASGTGRATASGTSTAVAEGIVLGDGDDVSANNGAVSVLADAGASARAASSGSGTGDAFSTATGNATSFAYGANLGGGTNSFINTGDLSVVAMAAASTETQAAAGSGICITFLFWTWCGGSGTPTHSQSQTLHADAFGIIMGDGDNVVRNDGTIDVSAVVSSTSTSSRTSVTTSLSAAGILGGNGSDTIINNGTISATMDDRGTLSTGVGIDTGAGNDSLQLGDGSLIVGTVDLGLGDDTLILAGNPRIEDHLGNLLLPDAGDGNDLLVLTGDGAFFGSPVSFEHAQKVDDGTFWLDALATLDTLSIGGGTLELGSDYTFGQASSYSTFIHSDLSSGTLLVDGTVAIDGSLAVERRGDDYIGDGTRYTIVAATDALTGEFADVALPDALPLLHFELDTMTDSVDVVAVASSFGSVTTTPLHLAVAANLDGIAPGSTGDLREQLGTIQSMASGFDEAFASLSPDMHLTGTTNTVATSLQTTQLLRQHLGNARAVSNGSMNAFGAWNPVLLNYDGLLASAVDASTPATPIGPVPETDVYSASRAQTWLQGFAGRSTVDLIDGYTDYEQDMTGFSVGADWSVGPRAIAGASIGYSDAQIDMSKAAAATDVETWSGTLYATLFSDESYLEGGLFLGWQDHATERVLTIDGATRTASGQHDGRTTMAFIGGGRSFGFERWSVEPYATLYYFDMREDAFEESGAGDLSQLVDDKSVTALLGEFGATFRWSRPVRDGVLDWHLSLAYDHDFDIDDASITYAFAGAPTTFFSVDDRNLLAGSASLGAGLAYVRERSVLSLDYRGQQNADYRHQVLGARFTWAFN